MSHQKSVQGTYFAPENNPCVILSSVVVRDHETRNSFGAQKVALPGCSSQTPCRGYHIFGRNNSCEQLWCEGTNTEKPLKLLFAKRWRCFESLTLISHFYIGKSMCKLVAKLVSELDSTVNLWLLKMVKSDRKSTWKPKPDPTTLNLHF